MTLQVDTRPRQQIVSESVLELAKHLTKSGTCWSSTRIHAPLYGVLGLLPIAGGARQPAVRSPTTSVWPLLSCCVPRRSQGATQMRSAG